MPGCLKVGLIVVGVLILLVTAIGVGGYLFWKYNGEAIVAGAQVAEDEGRRFATGKDSAACMDEAARRTKGAGFSAAVTTRIFLENCLKAARLTDGFCDGVPGPTDFLKSVSWQTQLNQKYGLDPPFETAVLPQSIQEFCKGRSAPTQR
jgi:hypothetical protein